MIERKPITSHNRGTNAFAAYRQARQVRLQSSPKKKKKKTDFADRAPDRRMSGSDKSYYKQNKSAPKSGGGTQKRSTNISKGVREQQQKAYNETSGGRFTQGVIRNAMFAGLPSETKATYTDSKDKTRKVSESKAYKAGKVVGDFMSYGTGYGLAGKAIARATGKAVAKKAAKEVGEKVAKETTENVAKKTAGKIAKAENKLATKAGEKILKTNEKMGDKIAKSKAVQKYAEKKASKSSEVAKIAGTAKRKEEIAKDVGAKAADKITQSLIADATAGTVLDTARAKGEGMDIGLNKEYAKYMGTNALMNIGMGAGMEGLGAGAKAVAKSQAAKKGAQTVRKLVNGKQKEVKVKNESHVPSTLKGREQAEKISKIQKDFTEMPTVPKGKKMKEALSPEEIRQRRNVQNRYSEVTKESRARQEARGDYNRNLKKKGVKEEPVRQVKGIAPEMPKNADDYVARINTARKYADDNNLKFKDVVEEHNGNRAEAINDLFSRAKKEQDAAKAIATEATEKASKKSKKNPFKEEKVKIKKEERIRATDTLITSPEAKAKQLADEAEKAREKAEEAEIMNPRKYIEKDGATYEIESKHGKYGTTYQTKFPTYEKFKADNAEKIAQFAEDNRFLNEDDAALALYTRERDNFKPVKLTEEELREVGDPNINFMLSIDEAHKPTRESSPRVPKSQRGSLSFDEAVAFDDVQPLKIQGYAELEGRERAQFNKLSKDKEFIDGLNDSYETNGTTHMGELIQAANERGISQAKQAVKMYDEFLKNNRTFAKAETKTSTVTPRKKMISQLKEYMLTAKEYLTDSAESVWQYAKKVGDKELYSFLNRVRQTSSYAESMIGGEKQLIKIGNEVEEVGDSLRNIFAPIIEKGDDFYKDFEDYMYNRHNVQRFIKGKPVYGETHSVKESNKVIRDLMDKYKDDFALFEEYADKIYKYNDALQRMSVDSGLISKEAYETLKKEYPYYVPTYRRSMSDSGMVKDLDEIGTKVFKKAVGSSKDILPLHEQMAHRTREVLNACAFNDFAYRLMKDMKSEGKVKATILDEDDIADSYITDIIAGKFQNALEETKDGKYIINVRDAGKIVKLEVDKHIFGAAKDLGTPTPKLPIANKANNIFRSLVTTYNPTFGPTNGIRDFLDAPSFSKHGAIEFVGAYGRAWRHITTDSDAWKIYSSLGGKGGGFFDFGEGFKNYKSRANAFHKVVTFVPDRIERVNEFIEQVPRFAEFLLTLEKGGNSKENLIKAFNNAQELTVNFGRSGKFTRILNANGATFMNAAVQDLVRMSRAAQSGAVAKMLLGATVFGIAPSVINEYVCGDDKNYQAIRQGEKDTNFFIPMSIFDPSKEGEFIKVPKGRVVSSIAAPIQRGVRSKMGNADERGAMSGVLKSVAGQVGVRNPAEENLLTPAAQAFLKGDEGKTWYGGDIVPKSLRKLPPAEQFDENTTNLAIAIGRQTNVSPKKIDYVIKQYTGIIGTTLRANSITGTVAASGNPFLTKFVTDAVTNNELQTRVFSKTDELEKLSNSSKATEEDKQKYRYFSDASKQMSDFNKQVKELQSRTDLSDKEKLKMVKEIRDQQNKVAEDYLESLNRVGSASKDAVKQVDKEAFAEYDDNTQYESALKTQMEVNMRGASAVIADEDARIREYNKKHPEEPKDLLSKKIKDAGLTPEGYFALQAKNISISTYVGAKKHNTDLSKYNDYIKTKAKYKGGFPSHAMELINNGMIKNADEAKEVYGIKKQSYKVAQFYLDSGYTPEQVYKLTGNVKKISNDIKNNYGHDTWSNGTVVMSKEGLKRYLDSRKDLTKAQKHNLWFVYGWARQDWIRANPY